MDGMIVVGSDSSAPSREAVSWAVQRAADLSLSVLLCHVIEVESPSSDGGAAESVGDARSALEAEANRVRSSFPTVDIHIRVHRGELVPTIAEVARQADCVVIGTHKTGFIYGRIFQSRVADLTSCVEVPVAFVPYGDTSHRRGVVAAIGESSSVNAVVRRAGLEARRFGDGLVLLGSSEHGTSIPVTAWIRARAPLEDSSDGQPSGILTTAARRAASSYPDLSTVIRQSEQSAATALLDASLSARLLVLGVSTLPARTSLITDVLLNLSCPTLVVRDSGLASTSEPSTAFSSTDIERSRACLID